ncbi:MAG TPA: GNAT family N-acetyltransferase [Candidatus Elarobacter sp.]|nr:GNAT family N-acetyltransferase [Candidatus Elarobacter sp.]
MKYLAITSLEEFERHRDQWDALYHADPVAHLFLSSEWLKAHLAILPHEWTIHVLADGDTFVGALATATRAVPHRLLPIAREVRFATDPFAEYQGMLARPARESEVVAELAAVLKSAAWQWMKLRDVRDARVADMVERLAAAEHVRLRRGPATTSYQIDLPNTYDALLERHSKPTRRALRRGLKMMHAELPNFRITRAPDGDADRHIETVVGLNSARWHTSTLRRARLIALYRNAYREGIARFIVLWDGTRPISGGAALIDPVTSTFGFALVAHDDEYARMSPGKAVFALFLQDAIELGYRTFDFLRGEGGYKPPFATRTSASFAFELVRSGVRGAALQALSPAYDVAKKAIVRVAMRAR